MQKNDLWMWFISLWDVKILGEKIQFFATLIHTVQREKGRAHFFRAVAYLLLEWSWQQVTS